MAEAVGSVDRVARQRSGTLARDREGDPRCEAEPARSAEGRAERATGAATAATAAATRAGAQRRYAADRIAATSGVDDDLERGSQVSDPAVLRDRQDADVHAAQD